MERKAAKELLHIHGWLDRVDEIVERGRDAYTSSMHCSRRPATR